MNFFSTFVASTAFKYIVAMVATYVANKLGLDPVEGKANIESILTQLIGVAMAIWGMWESSKDKLVLNGEKVTLPPVVADGTTAKGAKDILVGRVSR